MKHRWMVAGGERDGDPNHVVRTPNLWRCDRCGMYRATGRGAGSGLVRRRRVVIEYSTAAGEVIEVDPGTVPTCSGEHARRAV